ncbi:MAG: hypothetical protein E7K70_26405 [Klebsiella sp.]|uniref:hypothetical protein n=1 Tax=Klebsiella TaxID=570 RepID=UPI001C80B994|nr:MULTISPECIES: hypothetical protein [Klebsiella]MBX4822651.1 hypothetical protein [Klebsiella michiganensis]MDU7530554.1 hypothetical protein [Klebsiella sp.]
MTNLPDDYFLDADDELVDFLEKQGEESIKETYQSNTTNIENGYKLLNIQIVGIGSSFLLLTQKTSWDYLTAGLVVFIFLWTWSAIYLVHAGLSAKNRALIHSPPECLYTKTYKNINELNYQYLRSNGYNGPKEALPVMRRYRLKNLTDTAAELRALNSIIRTSLDRARMATILAPVIALIASAITFCFS